ncbi:MAG TPA: hypothetical protein VF177_16250, partial [Anaerolineae bacterium]
PSHIFHNSNPYTFLIHRYVPDISPRPLALVMHSGHAMGGDEDELATLFQSSKRPHRVKRSDEVNREFLLELLAWIRKESKP